MFFRTNAYFVCFLLLSLCACAASQGQNAGAGDIRLAQAYGQANQIASMPMCYDARGIAVTYMADPSLNDVGRAGNAPNGMPVVFMNPRILQNLHPAQQQFWFLHECAHHALGHSLGSTHPLMMEQNADCAAIRHMRDSGNLDQQSLQIILNMISQSPGDATHKAGPTRAQDILMCAQSP